MIFFPIFLTVLLATVKNVQSAYEHYTEFIFKANLTCSYPGRALYYIQFIHKYYNWFYPNDDLSVKQKDWIFGQTVNPEKTYYGTMLRNRERMPVAFDMTHNCTSNGDRYDVRVYFGKHCRPKHYNVCYVDFDFDFTDANDVRYIDQKNDYG
ncbi:unnamed protein product [Caenorhabditis angaria]|uniref:Uncharacterized protein n=1 Tax=Caenorhabditis angaria TaxID=860376 RepID=A0A9P1IFC6_9PELO|nr:unnamed protein product [Caenorhabditis angaria]